MRHENKHEIQLICLFSQSLRKDSSLTDSSSCSRKGKWCSHNRSAQLFSFAIFTIWCQIWNRHLNSSTQVGLPLCYGVSDRLLCYRSPGPLLWNCDVVPSSVDKVSFGFPPLPSSLSLFHHRSRSQQAAAAGTKNGLRFKWSGNILWDRESWKVLHLFLSHNFPLVELLVPIYFSSFDHAWHVVTYARSIYCTLRFGIIYSTDQKFNIVCDLDLKYDHLCLSSSQQ